MGTIFTSREKIRKTQLEDGAVFALGGMELMFRKKPLAQTTRVVDEIKPEAVPAEAYKRLVAFSEKLAHAKNIDSLLDTLMDEALHLTNAKGFLVLLDQDRPSIKVARNIHGENIKEAVSQLSDTIVTKVLENQKPLLIKNALKDDAFNASVSVINLDLTSVMRSLIVCSKLLGVLYVGNQKY